MKLARLALITLLITITINSFYQPIQAQSRAPGLPSYARVASARGQALPDIEYLARNYNLGEVFVATVKNVAQKESGATYARPAIRFDARPPRQRPRGKPLITAWGVFQFNRDAWTSVVPCQVRQNRRSWIPQGSRGCSTSCGCVFPWDSTAYEEIAVPIWQYGNLFWQVLNAGGNEIDGARSIWLWHIGSSIHRRWFASAQQRGFNAAWQNLNGNLHSNLVNLLFIAPVF